MGKNKQVNVSLKTAIIFIVTVVIVVVLITCGITIFIIQHNNNENDNKVITIGDSKKIDDWQYSNSQKKNIDYENKDENIESPIDNSDDVSNTSETNTVGENLSTEVKNANDFREIINNGYFPISTDINYNNVFNDYDFDIIKTSESNELLTPIYSNAISNDPISNNKEYYMTVGLNSNIEENKISRKKINLVVLLDISASMTSKFNSYYDESETVSEDINKSKMEIANESVNILIDELKDDDRFGMVLFDNVAYLGKPLSLIEETNVEAIKNHILEIEAAGGTNFENGYLKATELFEEYVNVGGDEYENRIIVITDAIPNYGDTSENKLLSYVEENVENNINTTFIGVGVDFNTELVDDITNISGANYYSVHNSIEFKEIMGEQFEYMITPLIFELKLDFKSEDFEIASVYGLNTVDKENGNIIEKNTLFLSDLTDSGKIKSEVILLKLNKKTDDTSGTLKLDVSYRDRNGEKYSNSQTIEIVDKEEYYENIGIRKAVLLSRYVNVLKNWIMFEKTEDEGFIISSENGIQDCNLTTAEVHEILGENENTSVKLKVSDQYRDTLSKIKEYIEKENQEIKDNNLENEINLLEKLITYQ